MQRRLRRVCVVVATTGALLAGAACGADGDKASGSGDGASGKPTEPPAVDVPVADEDHAVDPPPPLKARLWPADMLIYSDEELTDDMVDQIQDLKGIEATEQLSMGDVSIENKLFMVAAVDPASYRRFTPQSSAQQEEIWARVAGGELAVPQRLGEELQDDNAYITLGNEEEAPAVHIGAYADQIEQAVDLVVNEKWGEELGIQSDNALLISTGITSPQSVRKKIAKIVGDEASIQALDVVAREGLDPGAKQTAYLTGGSVAQAVGSFSYGVLGGGRIQPDPAWENANIRTEQVPILGTVTCHKVMLPQLRAALDEVVERGLADKIHPGEYAGCYYPRFIAGSNQLSLHSFGIALDLNTPGNQRGTVGEMDRSVVEIFKSWGFAWGGDWNYTDPMHFEMNALVEAR